MERYLRQIFEFANLTSDKEQIEAIVAAEDINRITEKSEGQYMRSGSVEDWKEQLSEAEVAMCDEVAGE